MLIAARWDNEPLLLAATDDTEIKFDFEPDATVVQFD